MHFKILSNRYNVLTEDKTLDDLYLEEYSDDLHDTNHPINIFNKLFDVQEITSALSDQTVRNKVIFVIYCNIFVFIITWYEGYFENELLLPFLSIRYRMVLVLLHVPLLVPYCFSSLIFILLEE